MGRYHIKTTIEIEWVEEVDSKSEALEKGWEWEDHLYNSAVYDIEVESLDDEEEEK